MLKISIIESYPRIKNILKTKNVASFIKTRFHSKRGCIKMCTYVEKFHTNRGCKLAIAVFIPSSPFSK